MQRSNLHNYVRPHRRRAGLSQRELALLLGSDHRASVSEIERQRVPLLRTALMLEIIFGIPVCKLFAGLCDELARDMGPRLLALASNLALKVDQNSRTAYRVQQKMNWINARTAVPSPDATAAETGPRA